MRKVLSIVIVMMAAMVCVSAQARPARQERTQFSEDTSATLKSDRPVREAEAFYPRTSFSYPVDDFQPGVVRVGPRTTYLKEGLRTDEVVRLLGKPASISERSENDVVTSTYEFQRGEGHILIAEFVDGVLVRSRTETREAQTEQADH
ncbi:MAG: hypothetical protein ACREA9_25180 [Pyrinomonadaceae bacterium]